MSFCLNENKLTHHAYVRYSVLCMYKTWLRIWTSAQSRQISMQQLAPYCKKCILRPGVWSTFYRLKDLCPRLLGVLKVDGTCISGVSVSFWCFIQQTQFCLFELLAAMSKLGSQQINLVEFLFCCLCGFPGLKLPSNENAVWQIQCFWKKTGLVQFKVIGCHSSSQPCC